jgi:ring-1,2-phenylacetyl-CoA epoxidase subunit PaaC
MAVSNEHLFAALLQLADDHLILGHRVSEWCGHAPMLEEDLALSNLALDLLGQARALYAYAGTVEGKGRDEDQLAFLRLERDYRNLLLVERPNGDFAHTVLRQFYFAAYMKPYWDWIAVNSTDETLRGIAGKAAKEMAYHVRHCGEWVIRLGDGTEESSARMRAAVEALHRYTAELFTDSPAFGLCMEAGILPARDSLKPAWDATVRMVFDEAGLAIPEIEFPVTGGRDGLHGEEMGHLLAELQYMQRTYPDMKW